MASRVERLSNLGYFALVKEVTKGTPLTPTTYLHAFKESMLTDLKLDENSPIVGTKSKIYNYFQGQRAHTGTIDLLAEPNTAEYILDMLLTAGTVTGSYIHPYTLSTSTNPKSYTLDIAKGQVVYRFWGVEAESLEPSYNKNKMHFNVGISALGSFTVREIATVNATTLTLKTDYDPTPNKGLVVGDLVRVMKADGSTTLDTTIATAGVNADGITVELSATAAAYAAGDFLFIRPATPTYATKTPFMWSRTNFCFADTATNALAATPTPVEQGAKWKIMHNFENKEGAMRSGSFDPTTLVRTQGDATLDLKMFFDYPDELNRFTKLGSRACVIRCYSETAYELRITLNSIVAKTLKPPLETGKIIYQEFNYGTTYNTSDAQSFDVKVINNLAA